MISCDTEWCITSWNTGAEQIYGYPRGEALGCDLFALLATRFHTADGVPVGLDAVQAELDRGDGWRGELHERRADGAPLTIMSSVSVLADAEHGRTGVVVVNRDISDQRREEHQALHDPLTGLPNRRLLTNRLYDALARAFRNQTRLALLFLDLDGFKPVNDRHGHAAGDEVLRAAARRLTAAVRQNDTVARLGGDEFVVLLEHAGDAAAVAQVAHRIADSVGEPVDVGGCAGESTVSVRPSIGVAYATVVDGEAMSPETLIEAADQAMYLAKRRRSGMAFADDRPVAAR
jgi:diguanylate cyclase (GGDEF)-like protein/PAS domain S-box-containing protein